MNRRFWALLPLCFIAVVPDARSDLGPKPSIDFRLADNASPAITDGALILCERADCADGALLEPLGPQHFDCYESACRGIAYGFAPYLQLTIRLSDGRTLRSQVFEKREFDAVFLMHIEGDVLAVEECDQACRSRFVD